MILKIFHIILPDKEISTSERRKLISFPKVELTNEYITKVDEIKELLINRKWYYTIFEGIKALYVTTSHEIAGRIAELAERYEDTLPSLESDVNIYEAKVKVHLERMGFVW